VNGSPGSPAAPAWRRVLVAPDSFGGSMSASEAAAALATGWQRGAPDDVLTLVPLSDGGPGFVEVLHAGLDGQLIDVEVRDPLGRPVPGQVLVTQTDRGRTAYVESAQAAGLHLLAPDERDPTRTTSAGVADLLRAALDAGADHIVVGLGGSGTNDGGIAMTELLGADTGRLREIDLVVATDVDNPLLGPSGATAVYGPQKGADAAMTVVLEERLARFADVVAPELAEIPGAGAAGGLGFALFALGGRRVAGADLVLQLLDVDAKVAASDVVLTGEGCLDSQTLHGKLPARVAASCLDAGVPCIAIAGQVRLGRRQLAVAGFAEAHALETHAGSLEAAIAQGPTALSGLAADVARAYRPGPRADRLSSDSG
jgi:glycerate kinase